MFFYYDIGVNLFCEQFHDPEAILQGAADAGVGCILTGSDMPENEAIVRFLPEHAAWGTCGIHPHGADRAREEDFTRIEEIVSTVPGIVAVGECGLDYNRMFSAKENQLSCLARHIEIAERTGMPMFLHERDAAGDFARSFTEHPEVCRRSVVHCFTGDRRTLETYLEMGFSIGITGWITDNRRADELRDAVQILPPDRVLLETDCPYLRPRGFKGLPRVNVPENVKYVAQSLAGYMGISEEALLTHARENTERLFGL